VNSKGLLKVDVFEGQMLSRRKGKRKYVERLEIFIFEGPGRKVFLKINIGYSRSGNCLIRSIT
jgi:hypothetical protein